MTEAPSLKQLLAARRKALLAAWLEVLLATYSDQASRFMKSTKNQIANPVGSTLSRSLEGLYDQLHEGLDPDQAIPLLEGIIRIRALQDFAPSDALAFIYQFKGVVRQECRKQAGGVDLSSQLAELDESIDRLGLLAFDLYTACREKVHQIRHQEFLKNNHMLLRRAKLLVDKPGKQPESKA